jgi:hypothetical protein
MVGILVLGGVCRTVEEIVVEDVMEIHGCIVVLHNKNCKELAVIKTEIGIS